VKSIASEEVAARLAVGGARLRPSDWRSGEAAWVVDCIAPFGGADEMVADLKAKVFPARELSARVIADGRAQVRRV
jgi:cytolysin-activating lysine-acyltransferase